MTNLSRKDIQIGVFGLGFVGLTTALGFAEKGYLVKGYDVDNSRLHSITQGIVPFLEPGLDEALSRHLGIKFVPVFNPIEAIQKSDVIFFCVGTPCGAKGKADLTYLFSALDCVVRSLHDAKFRVLVIKSTVPPGTTQKAVIPYLQSQGLLEGKTFAVANNPEFLREGTCWEDFIKPDRIVCGTDNKKAFEILRVLYEPFNAPIHQVSLNTSEFIKYLSNTLLASLISYSNEMSIIADALGDIDTGKAFRILHEDKRMKGLGITGYVYPGCGYGGYCLPKDTQAMAAQARMNGIVPRLLEDVIAINDGMPAYFIRKITSLVSSEKTIGILGLSFKPNSDDIRDSPAVKIISLLINEGYDHITAYDPAAMEQFEKVYQFKNIDYCGSGKIVCEKSDVIVLVTAWSEFKSLFSSFSKKPWIDCRYFLP
ncbi:UDPglucose 6-dehydrogenase [Hollandina sp. SP2]